MAYNSTQAQAILQLFDRRAYELRVQKQSEARKRLQSTAGAYEKAVGKLKKRQHKEILALLANTSASKLIEVDANGYLHVTANASLSKMRKTHFDELATLATEYNRTPRGEPLYSNQSPDQFGNRIRAARNKLETDLVLNNTGIDLDAIIASLA